MFANYITGTCVSIFFLCISRVCFSVNYNHFIQLKKIEQNNQEIIKENGRQTEILSVVAHDLHSPINSVIGLIDILKTSEPTAEEKNEYYDMILATCNRSNAIIDDLLDTARNEHAETTFVDTCMNDFIGDVIDQFIKSKAGARHMIYEKPAGKIYASIDRNKMMRVFDNLLGNAAKFTREDGIITIKMSHNTDKICITVADNGIGIPKELVPFLFNKFSKAGRSGLKGERSYGLGMSICKLIIKQHHGDITASGEEGKGTQIKITIPSQAGFSDHDNAKKK